MQEAILKQAYQMEDHKRGHSMIIVDCVPKQDSADDPFEVANSLVFKVTSHTIMKNEMKT